MLGLVRLSDRQLDAFRATVALGSVTAAARALHVTQPAISRLLAELEAELGFAVLERAGRGVRPTVEGRLLFEEVERSYLGLQAVRERAALIRDGGVGQLRLVCMPAFAETFVAPAVGAFLRDAPGIGVELEVLNTVALVEGVRRGRFDVGVAAPLVEEPDLVWTVLRSAEMVIAMAPDHPLAPAGRVDAGLLAAHDLLVLPADSPYRLRLQAALARFGQRGIRIAGTVRTQSAACEMIAAGCPAATIVDPCIASRYRDALVARPLDFELRSDLALCHAPRHGRGAPPALRRRLEERLRAAG